MPGEDDYFPLRNTCSCCGASVDNNYRHDENCLANLPVHTDELLKWWYIGHNERRAGAKPSIHMKLDIPQDKAYMMGYRCPQLVQAAA